MGTEELTWVALVLGLVSLGLIAGPVEQPTQVRTRSAPTATTASSEVIAMRGQVPTGFGYLWDISNINWHRLAQIKLSIPPIYSNFLVQHTLPAPIGVG